MINKKIILRVPKVLESLGHGEMQYWSVEKKDINPLANTPVLHYSSAPKLNEIECSYEGLRSFRL